MAFFCAEEPEASSLPLASSHLMLPAALWRAAAAVVSPLLSSEPHAVRTRAPETARAPSGEGAKPVLALKLHFRVFLPGAAGRGRRAKTWCMRRALGVRAGTSGAAAPCRAEIRQIR